MLRSQFVLFEEYGTVLRLNSQQAGSLTGKSVAYQAAEAQRSSMVLKRLSFCRRLLGLAELLWWCFDSMDACALCECHYSSCHFQTYDPGCNRTQVVRSATEPVTPQTFATMTKLVSNRALPPPSWWNQLSNTASGNFKGDRKIISCLEPPRLDWDSRIQPEVSINISQ